MKPTSVSHKPPSPEFEGAICDGGTVWIMCEFCERVHFTSSERNTFESSWGTAELDTLLAEAAKDPDKYVDHGSDWVHWGTIDGRNAVIGCPCNRVTAYEVFIWTHRHLIAKYMKALAERRLLGAIADIEAAKEVTRSLEQLG